MNDQISNEIRKFVKKELDRVTLEIEEKIRLAVKENDTEFLHWFFFTCNDQNKFKKLLNNQGFNNEEKEYLRNFLVEMGKI